MRCLFTIILSLFTFYNLQAQSIQLQDDWWQPDGNVSSIARDSVNNIYYLGGNFENIAPFSPYSAIINLKTGYLSEKTATPNAPATTSIPDGNGGWFIGGSFNKVGDSIRNKVAHLDSNGNITSLVGKFGFNNDVTSLAKRNDTLYVGGTFTAYGKNFPKKFTTFDLNSGTQRPIFNDEIDGNVKVSIPDGSGGYFIAGSFSTIGNTRRVNIAQIDSFGNLTNWSPKVYGSVNAMIRHGNTIYLGGYFNQVNDSLRNHLVAIDVSSGNVIGWNPRIGNTNGGIETMRLVNDTLYFGGAFSMVSGANRTNAASVNINTGILTNWAPNISNIVYALEIDKGFAFIGGFFYNAGGSANRGLAKVDLLTGAILPFNANVVGTVRAIEIVNDKVYFGGEFNSVGSQTRNNIAVVNKVNASLLNWNPDLGIGFSPTVRAIKQFDSTVYVGGAFLHGTVAQNGIVRTNLISLDTLTALPTSWSPNPTGLVTDINITNSKLSVSGNFLSIGGVSRGHLAAIDITTGNVTSFNPIVNGDVYDLIIEDSTLFVGGSFSKVLSQTRNNLSSINLNAGTLNAWNPNCNGPINDMDYSGNELYVGGRFDTINGQRLTSLAELNPITGVPTSWSPPILNITAGMPTTIGEVYILKVDGNAAYVSGNFNFSSGQRNFERFNISSGQTTSGWDLYRGGVIHDILVTDTNVYFAGSFQYMVNLPSNRKFLTAYNKFTKNVINWAPNPSYHVYTIAADNKKMYVGGYFKSIGGVERKNIAAIDALSGKPTSFNLQVNHFVSDLILKDSLLYISGYFDSLNGTIRNRLGAYNTNLNSITTWNPNVNGYINAIEIFNNTVYLGGNFSTVNGQNRQHLAAVDKTTANVMNWNPNPNNVINKLIINDSSLFTLGNYTSIMGQNRNGFAEFNAVTSQLSQLTITTNSTINSVAKSDSILYVGGSFDTIQGVARKGIAAINLKNLTITNWNPNIDGGVDHIKFRNNSIYLGGYFTKVGQYSINHFVRVDEISGSPLNWISNSNEFFDYYNGGLRGFHIDNQNLLITGFSSSTVVPLRSFLGAFSYSLITSLKGSDSILSRNTKLNIYPNPSKNIITVESKGVLNEYIALFDLSGKLISRITTWNQDKVRIDISDLPSGIYLIKSGVEVRKFVVSK